ncbi:hypothetical protein FHS95_003886 [Sphingomonas naasensis]|uniref:Uncharacterized protein n=1 Tax=Sphingomonas naasensis TaxID=1344951 RepID=A0A4S1WGK3_9SPHN|nr:hypothetical protein [Sphingomonas naasensis]NIJ22171.1 hypothetical protein [Sphingomonas naasensis]TGX40807.1 hypothetical protein E5A74_15105 [Sphingomonas naasensis]
MTSIDRISGLSPLSPTNAASTDARGAAIETMGEIGHRVLAWVDAASRGANNNGGSGAQAWSQTAGSGSGFAPDMGELARRGDVYGLGELTSDLSARFGASPAQEGALRRAIDDFTRAAVIQIAGLSGASGDQQVSGVRAALDGAARADAPAGLDGVIARFEAATADLSAQNRG